MTIWQRDYTKETGWGHCEEPDPHTPYLIYSLCTNMHRRTLIIKRPKKRLKPTHTS